MKKFIPAWSVFVLGLFIIAFLAGCGSVSSSPAPTPTPLPNPSPTPITPTPTPPPAAHGTFVYFNTSASNTIGYRLNPDGTLTPLAGSPFAVSGGLAAAGNFLAVASGSTVSAYAVDPASGGLTQTGTATVNGGGAIAADAKNVYVAGNIPANNSTGIYGFALSATGMLTPLAGSPYTFTGACDFCDVPVALALNNNFLVQGGVGFHGVGDFTTYLRGAGGVLGAAQILGTDAEEAVTIQRPTGSFSYALDTSDFSLNEFTINASGKATPGAQLFVDHQPQSLTTDVTGKFLLVLDTAGVVHVFTINPANGDMSQIGTSEAAGANPGGITLDPSGNFVFVPQAANPNFPAAVNQITVFTFDPASGAMKKLQSYPQASEPGAVVVIAR